MGIRDSGRMAAVILALVASLAPGAGTQPASPHHGFLGGPWEILAKMGHEGAGDPIAAIHPR